MTDPFALLIQITDALIAFIPRLAGALLFILFGWLVATLAYFGTQRLLKALNNYVNTRFSQLGAETSRLHHNAIKIIPKLVYWFLLIIAFAAATATLELPIFTDWLGRALQFMPHILTAIVIIFAGLWGSFFLRDIITRMLTTARLPYAEVLGRLCQISLVAVTVVIAVSQLGVDLSFLTTISSVLLAGPLAAIAVAFGLGARTMMSNILACYYVHKIYRVGNVIEIEGARGTIVKITGAFVLIETPDGQVTVPAKNFAETSSRLIKKVE
ncbi:MAG: mechanosensitive ion channel domain-containing protein [Verrucomicrobiota bacterium]